MRVSKVLSIVTLHIKYRGGSVGTAGGKGEGEGAGAVVWWWWWGGGKDPTREITCPRTQDTP